MPFTGRNYQGISSKLHIKMGLQYIRALCCCLFLQMLTSASSHIIKRRFCVAFEIDNFKNAHKVFDSVTGMSRRRCMMRCAGHSLCTGFSYHAHERACALSSGKMTCTSITSWLVVCCHVSMSGATTLASQTPKRRRLVLASTRSNWRQGPVHQSNFLYGHVYSWLFGWQETLHCETAYKTRTSCKARCGKILDLARTAGYSWTPLVPGDAVPANATVGGYGPDGEDLVIARRVLEYEEFFGYYSKIMKASYFNVEGGVAHFGTVDILVTW